MVAAAGGTTSQIPAGKLSNTRADRVANGAMSPGRGGYAASSRRVNDYCVGFWLSAGASLSACRNDMIPATAVQIFSSDRAPPQAGIR